jgi:hypothetical protein
MSEKVILDSGAQLEITPAPFTEAERLFSAVAACVKSVKIDGAEEVDSIAGNLNGIKDMFLSCITSKEVKDALLAVLKRCAYNGQKISGWEFFDDMGRREDYLPALWEVAKFNLSPFTKNLFAKFQNFARGQKSESQK